MQQEDINITIINIYIHINRPAKDMKEKLTELKRYIDNSTIVVGDFNTSLDNRTTRQKIRK